MAKDIMWTAICMNCIDESHLYLDRAANGQWIEATAKIHKRDHPDHTVLVAYEVEVPE